MFAKMFFENAFKNGIIKEGLDKNVIHFKTSDPVVELTFGKDGTVDEGLKDKPDVVIKMDYNDFDKFFTEISGVDAAVSKNKITIEGKKADEILFKITGDLYRQLSFVYNETKKDYLATPKRKLLEKK